jgi:hypothetical protein
MSLADLAGIMVITSPILPLDPSPATDARRIVRHGLADILEWLGEPVGPKPGQQTVMLLCGRDLYTSAAIVGQLRERIE